MRKRIMAILVLSLLVLGFATHGFAETVEEAFKRMFPKLNYDTINPTGMKGLYEVVVGNNIAYFNPEEGYLMVGEIIDKTETNITAKRRTEISRERNQAAAAKAKDLPLEKAVKIGSGKNTVIEITDPDCPYCRKASDFFGKRNDVTRYVFFLPLSMHKDAENKVKYVLCSTDRAKAYDEAMHGKLDDRKYEICSKPEVEELAKVHKGVADSMGVTGTPFFVVNGTVVPGANMAMIEGALIK
jgi:thiol:disulfide interchange protein DsbC